MAIFKPNIEKLKSKGDVQRLAKALTHESPEIREDAAKAMAQLRDAAVIKPLIDATRDRSCAVREAAAQALIAALGNESLTGNVESIAQSLGDALRQSCSHRGSYLDVSRFLIEALVKIGDANAQSAIIEVLTNKNLPLYGVQQQLWNALTKIGWEPGRDEVSALYWATKGNVDKCVQIGEPAVEVLISMIDYNRLLSSAQEIACEALGRIGDPRAVGPLIAVSNAHSPNVRKAAIEALGRIGDPAALKTLFSKTMQSKFHSVEAACALGSIAQKGELRAKELLIRVLEESWNMGVLKAVTTSLNGLGWEPDMDEVGAKFWAIEKQWKKCLEIGIKAVVPILKIGPQIQNIQELEDACMALKGSRSFRQALHTYLKYLNQKLSRAEADVKYQEDRWGGSSFPDYLSRDLYQELAARLRQRMSRVQEELDRLN